MHLTGVDMSDCCTLNRLLLYRGPDPRSCSEDRRSHQSLLEELEFMANYEGVLFISTVMVPSLEPKHLVTICTAVFGATPFQTQDHHSTRYQ